VQANPIAVFSTNYLASPCSKRTWLANFTASLQGREKCTKTNIGSSYYINIPNIDFDFCVRGANTTGLKDTDIKALE
jgi:hypothetical protein